jgi:hypothetical protein
MGEVTIQPEVKNNSTRFKKIAKGAAVFLLAAGLIGGGIVINRTKIFDKFFGSKPKTELMQTQPMQTQPKPAVEVKPKTELMQQQSKTTQIEIIKETIPTAKSIPKENLKKKAQNKITKKAPPEIIIEVKPITPRNLQTETQTTPQEIKPNGQIESQTKTEPKSTPQSKPSEIKPKGQTESPDFKLLFELLKEPTKDKAIGATKKIIR